MAGRGASSARLAAEFPSIAQLSRDEMREVLGESHDPRIQEDQAAYFDALLHSLPEVRDLYDEHKALLERVEEQAARNAELRPKLEAVRAATRAAYEHARAADAAWPAVEREMNEAYKTRLQLAAAHAHDESEALANAYVEGLPATDSLDMIDDTTFVRHYRALRTLYHRRALLHEQCTHQRVQWRT